MAVLARPPRLLQDSTWGLIVEEGVIWAEDTSSLNESNANETVADRGTVSSTLEQT